MPRLFRRHKRRLQRVVSDPSEVVLDISGYFAPVGNSAALDFYPLTPSRLVDTRNANAPLGGPTLLAGPTRVFPLQSGSCNLPSDAAADSPNVTAVPQGGLPYLTISPSGQPQPTASTLNAPTGNLIANAAVVPAGSNGDLGVRGRYFGCGDRRERILPSALRRRSG
jgi:hypothetical protein